MTLWKTQPKQWLEAQHISLTKSYETIKSKGLKLDMSRGKPSPDVLDLSNGLLDNLENYITPEGIDIRNYGEPFGLPGFKTLLSELLDIPQDQMIVGGNASLAQMYNVLFMLMTFGAPGYEPWGRQGKIKFLCPVPGYDRHFSVTEDFGIEMLPVPMTADGPDMDAVESLARSDSGIKGIWCVPLYSNPQGVVYSDETVGRLAAMETAAPDFRIFWDNAYGVHHVFEEHQVKNILQAAAAAGNPERPLYFFSTSKVTFPGGGVAVLAAGPENLKFIKTHLLVQTIGYDKISQQRTLEFFKDAEGVRAHMRKIAEILRPKFETVLETLKQEFADTDLATWITPKGGYFISVDVPDGCAKRVVALAKDAGAILTGAGATWPCKEDPKDSNIRIAPTYPTPEELKTTMELLVVCIKLAAIERFLQA